MTEEQKQKHRAANKLHYANNKELRRGQIAEWQDGNWEKLEGYKITYQKKHSRVLLTEEEKQKRNRESNRDSWRKRYNSDPVFREAEKQRARENYLKRKQAQAEKENQNG